MGAPVADPFARVKNFFHAGNYEKVLAATEAPLQAASGLSIPSYVLLEQSALHTRALIAVGKADLASAYFDKKHQQHTSSLNLGYQSLQLLIQYSKVLSKFRVKPEGTTLQHAEELTGIANNALELAGKVEANNSIDSAVSDIARCLLSQILISEGFVHVARRLLAKQTSLESRGLYIQVLLKCNDIRAAEDVVRELIDLHSESVLAQLAEAWVLMHTGGQSLRSAIAIYRELCDLYTATPTLLNGLAVCLMQSRDYEEAEECLAKAVSADVSFIDAHLNMITCLEIRGKSVPGNLRSDLRGHHVLLNDIRKFEASFDEAAAAL